MTDVTGGSVMAIVAAQPDAIGCNCNLLNWQYLVNCYGRNPRNQTSASGATTFLSESVPVLSMSGNRPSEEELRRGMTVEINQSNADNDNPIRGEIKRIIDEGESPQGVKVELESGVTGYVEQVVTD